jgi:hypothetical protein
MLTLVLVLVAGLPAFAQMVVVFDPAVTLRNSITATIQQLLSSAQSDQRQQIERMARRIRALTDAGKYAFDETPEWRIHDFLTDAVLFAHNYHAALNYGDGAGFAYNGIVERLVALDSETAPVSVAAWTTLETRLATIDAADAVAIAATNDAGLLRYNGRREQAAIEALQADVIDASEEQSTTAVLEKINGAALIAARQRQARMAFISGIVEQLLIDTKRARDTDTTALNMQLTTWREAAAVNAAFASGMGDALRAWRQP